jgi:hypothetical protein
MVLARRCSRTGNSHTASTERSNLRKPHQRTRSVAWELRYGPVDDPSSDPALEQVLGVCWIRPDLPDRDADRLVERRSKAPDLVVIDPLHDDWACHECGGNGDLLMMEGPGPICLGCAGLDHLTFLPADEATLTRRAKKARGSDAPRPVVPWTPGRSKSP